jgi:hypothetical protein
MALIARGWAVMVTTGVVVSTLTVATASVSAGVPAAIIQGNDDVQYCPAMQ